MSLGITKHQEHKHQEIRNQIEEFLAKGGKIQKLETTQRVRTEVITKSMKKNIGNA